MLPALAVMIKGPVAAVLPVLVLAVLTVVTGQYARVQRFRPGLGAIVAVTLAGSWYVIAALRAPEYLWVFLWLQNVGRFLSGEPGSGHSEPFWFFFWVLPVTFLPWTLFLPAAFHRAVQRARSGCDLERFLLAWVGVVFVFFSLSRAKLATYMLPAFPPLALLVAVYLARVLRAPAPALAHAFKIPGMLWTAGMALADRRLGGRDRDPLPRLRDARRHRARAARVSARRGRRHPSRALASDSGLDTGLRARNPDAVLPIRRRDRERLQQSPYRRGGCSRAAVGRAHVRLQDTRTLFRFLRWPDAQARALA